MNKTVNSLISSTGSDSRTDPRFPKGIQQMSLEGEVGVQDQTKLGVGIGVHVSLKLVMF